MSRGRKVPVFGVIAAFLLLAIGIIAVWRASITSANKDLLRAIAARGEPTSLAELNSFYKAVPDSNNAALLWLDGFAALTNDLGNIAGNLTLKRGVSLNEDQLTAEALAANREALALFHRAARLGQSRYPINLSQSLFTNLDHLGPLKGAAQVLRAQAAVAVTQNNTALATEAINAIFAAGRSMATEPSSFRNS